MNFQKTNQKQASGIVNQHLPRYVFTALRDIDLSGTQITSPMSINRIKAGEINVLVPASYKHRDESSIADGIDNPDLKESIQTPYAQLQYLMDNYSQEGLVYLEELTGIDPESGVAQAIEGLLGMPFTSDVPLPMLRDNLRPISEEALAASEESVETKALAESVLEKVMASITQADTYTQNFLDSIEAEIISGRSGKNGKPFLDGLDRFLYGRVGRIMPRDKDLDFKAQSAGDGDAAINKFIERFSEVVAAKAAAPADPNIITLTREELAAMIKEGQEEVLAKVKPSAMK